MTIFPLSPCIGDLVKEPRMHIFLDMDGVIADFVGGAARAFGKDPAKLEWPGDRSSVHIPLGLESEDEMWRRLDMLGPEFWEKLDVYPWADELWDVCARTGKVTILTKPSRSPDSASGKVRWLKRWKGERFRDYIICAAPKWLLAAPMRLLIDDHEKHFRQFREHLGKSILFPQPWNMTGAKPDPAQYIDDLLDLYRPTEGGKPCTSSTSR